MTRDRDVAADWFVRFEGAGLDGVMAKPADGTYEQNKRVQFKVKHRRTADCVVAGFRMHKDGDGVGSLLLGLYDDEHRLNHVGVASSFTARRRKELLGEVSLYLVDSLEDHPWRSWAEAQAHDQVNGRLPGREQPMERQEGSELDPVASGAGGRGHVRTGPERPVPSFGPTGALAPGPHPRVVHLQPAR